MAHVTVKLNGRAYKLNCGDDEEPRLRELADCVSVKLEELVEKFGQVGHDRLMLMAALLIADELFDARDALSSAGSAKAKKASA